MFKQKLYQALNYAVDLHLLTANAVAGVRALTVDNQRQRFLSMDDFVRILTEPGNALTKQQQALLAVEGMQVKFEDEAIGTIADMAAKANETVENIGARRLQTVMEKLLEDISFHAPDRSGTAVVIDRAYVVKNVSELAKDTDLTKFIL